PRTAWTPASGAFPRLAERPPRQRPVRASPETRPGPLDPDFNCSMERVMMSEPTSAGSTTAQAAETTLPAGPLDVTEVMRILPHRYPFLLVDRVLEMRPGYIVGQKCVSVNEPFFQGHFPSKPVMPGVLQIEAIAQVGAVLEGLYPDR